MTSLQPIGIENVHVEIFNPMNAAHSLPSYSPSPIKTITLRDKSTVRCIPDIPYCTCGHRKHKLDLFLPAISQETTPSQHTRTYPLMFFVHGGGWRWGNRRHYGGMYSNVGHAFAQKSYATAVISYRLSSPHLITAIPFYFIFLALISLSFSSSLYDAFGLNESVLIEFHAFRTIVAFIMGLLGVLSVIVFQTIYQPIKHPHHCHDALRALQFLYTHSDALNIDKDKIVASGHSAGGHILTWILFHKQRQQLLAQFGLPNDVFKSIVSISSVLDIPAMSIRTRGFKHFCAWAAFSSRAENWIAASPFHQLEAIYQMLESSRDSEKEQEEALALIRHIPPILFLNGSYADMGLEIDTANTMSTFNRIKNLLSERGHDGAVSALRVESRILQGFNHFEIIRTMGQPWRSRNGDMMTPLMDNFVSSCLTKKETQKG